MLKSKSLKREGPMVFSRLGCPNSSRSRYPRWIQSVAQAFLQRICWFFYCLLSFPFIIIVLFTMAFFLKKKRSNPVPSLPSPAFQCLCPFVFPRVYLHFTSFSSSSNQSTVDVRPGSTRVLFICEYSTSRKFIDTRFAQKTEKNRVCGLDDLVLLM